jgi:hypothetical protein
MAEFEINQDGVAHLSRAVAARASELQVAGDALNDALLALTAASGMNVGGPAGTAFDASVWSFVDARLSSVALMASQAENLRTATENAVGALVDVDRQLSVDLSQNAPGQG